MSRPIAVSSTYVETTKYGLGRIFVYKLHCQGSYRTSGCKSHIKYHPDLDAHANADNATVQGG